MAALAACVLLTACSQGRGPGLPDALRTYLDALVAGEYRTAYDRTGLQQLTQTSASAQTLSFEHFAAFHRGDPLRSYDVREVTRLDRRTIETVNQGGTAYYVVDLTLRHASAAIEQTISVDGEVLGVVEIDPVPVRVVLPRAGGPRGAPRPAPARLRVDGIATGPADQGGTLLLLAGAHDLAFGDDAARITTTPLRILSGAAQVRDGAVFLGAT